MLVRELIRQLKRLPLDSEIVITSLDDYFSCSDFEVRSYHEDERTQEIIMNVAVIQEV